MKSNLLSNKKAIEMASEVHLYEGVANITQNATNTSETNPVYD